MMIKALAFAMKSNTVGVSATTGRSDTVYFLIKAVYIGANTLQFIPMYKHFGVNYSVAVTEASVSGTDTYAFRADKDPTGIGLALSGRTYFYLDVMGIASGLEAIVCGIKSVVFVTTWGVFRRQDIRSVAYTMLSVIKAFNSTEWTGAVLHLYGE